MANNQDSGEKTEKATPRRLRDARKRGDVPKSKDVTSTLGLAFTLTLSWLVLTNGMERLASLTIDAMSVNVLPFDQMLTTVGTDAVQVFLTLSAVFLIPVAVFGMLIEFLQAGPIFAMDKVKPKLSKLDPAEGVKRMFSMDNFVEVLKSLGKTAILGITAYLVVTAMVSELALLPAASPAHVVMAVKTLTIHLLGWTLGIFLGLMALDAAYQQHSYAKKMKMSLRDIRQEHKENEGDPMMKGQRKQMHKEWAQKGATQAASSATVLVVNPTHVAIAILCDKEDAIVPLVTAKGEDDTARAMRSAANEAQVPVLRNELLARTLLADVEEGDCIPRGLFDVVAEVILWATRTSEKLAQQRGDIPAYISTAVVPNAPGEDLTTYDSHSTGMLQ